MSSSPTTDRYPDKCIHGEFDILFLTGPNRAQRGSLRGGKSSSQRWPAYYCTVLALHDGGRRHRLRCGALHLPAWCLGKNVSVFLRELQYRAMASFCPRFRNLGDDRAAESAVAGSA